MMRPDEPFSTGTSISIPFKSLSWQGEHTRGSVQTVMDNHRSSRLFLPRSNSLALLISNSKVPIAKEEEEEERSLCDVDHEDRREEGLASGSGINHHEQSLLDQSSVDESNMDTLVDETKLIDFLKSVSLFQPLSSAALVDLADKWDIQCFRRGDTVLGRGCPAHSVYVIVSGTLKQCSMESTFDLTVGDYFGASILFDDMMMESDVVCVTEVCLVLLSPDDLSTIICDSTSHTRNTHVASLRIPSHRKSSPQSAQYHVDIGVLTSLPDQHHEALFAFTERVLDLLSAFSRLVETPSLVSNNGEQNSLSTTSRYFITYIFSVHDGISKFIFLAE